MNDFETGFTLQLFHLSDQEANTTSVELAPNLSAVYTVLSAQDIDGDGEAGFADTLFLSSGDAWLPGLFYDASEDIYGIPGAADIEIQNELGIQAISFGNHEFDNGTEIIAQLLSGQGFETPEDGLPFGGADFPYLSGNLEFSADENLAPLVTGDHQDAADIAGRIAATTVVETASGVRIGVVGATTPEIDDGLTSPGDDVGVLPQGVATPESEADFDALAAVIQEDVDALLAANPGLDKVILSSHMQQFPIEQELATRLEGVDIIMAGGSNTTLLDETDAGFGGEGAQGVYPQFFTGADGNPVAVVNTDKSYEYLGRLVIDFDDEGVIIPESYDPELSGAFATDADGLARIGATEADIDPEIQAIADDVEAAILAGESTFFAVSEVFLNAERFSAPDGPPIDGVRSQETNLANLIAQSHLAAAQDADPGVDVAYINGGGIRQNIGDIVAPGGGGEPRRVPPEGVPGAKPEGGVSANNVADTLAFDNELVLLTLTGAQMIEIVENNVAGFTSVAAEADGFAHYAGLDFSFDPSLPEGDRVQSLALVDEETGAVRRTLIENGEVVPGAADAEVRIVTLNFLADIGDPLLSGLEGEAAEATDRVNLAEDGREYIGNVDAFVDGAQQDAFAEWLLAEFGTGDGSTAITARDVQVQQDTSIQNLAFRPDTVIDDDRLNAELVTVFQGESDPEDEDSPEGASEVVDHEDGRLYVTNGNLDRVDVFDLAAGGLAATVDLSTLANFDGVQSLAVSGGLLAVAVQNEPVDGVSQDGQVAFYDTETLELIESVAVGNLPDQVVFSPDGTTLAVMNEGEFNFEIEAEDGLTNDAPGSVSLISIDRSGETPAFDETRVSVADFAPALIDAGVRLDPNLDPANQFEPEYGSFSPDGGTLFVALQENNAAVAIDVASATIAAGLDFGTVDHSQQGNELDFNDDDEIEIVTAPLLGLRQPDSHVTFEVGGTTYLATANEGDGRGDATEVANGDEARVGDILAGEVPGVSIDPGVDTEGLDRITVSTVDGDTDGDGDIDQLHSFGGRGFTIFNLDTGGIAFDSGSDFELIVADLAPERFLDDDGEAGQNRADAKGVEPEAMAFGVVRDTPYLFIGAERDSGVFVYDVSDPADAAFVEYIDGFANDLIAPEIIEFIPEAESLTGNPQIAVSYEVSGETAVFDLLESAINEEVDGLYQIALGREAGPDGFEFWTGTEGVLTTRERADSFAGSAEFDALTEGLTLSETVDFLFENATGEAANGALNAFWTDVAEDQGFGTLVETLLAIDDTAAIA
jgi:2',3'-cyclic-nucleotide 2'-phosphodiesterase (5'-nucleotidase family)/DNA-binding beta-propeller fold protein YncE